MKPPYCVCFALVVNLVLLVPATATEKKIKRSDLPADVQKTVEAQSQGATVRGFSQETEGGNTYYEVELIVSSHQKDVLLDAKGTVVEVEEEVALDSLPVAVQEGLRAKAGNSQLHKVESLSKHGKLVAYEAHLMSNGKKSEIQVGPDGKPLGREE